MPPRALASALAMALEDWDVFTVGDLVCRLLDGIDGVELDEKREQEVSAGTRCCSALAIATVDDMTNARGGGKGLALEYNVDTLEYLIALHS